MTQPDSVLLVVGVASGLVSGFRRYVHWLADNLTQGQLGAIGLILIRVSFVAQLAQPLADLHILPVP
jgi:hypothetical protein